MPQPQDYNRRTFFDARDELQQKLSLTDLLLGLLGGIPRLGLGSVLPPLSNSWIISIIWLKIALNRTPNTDCYWGGGGGGQYPRFRVYKGFQSWGFRVDGLNDRDFYIFWVYIGEET